MNFVPACFLGKEDGPGHVFPCACFFPDLIEVNLLNFRARHGIIFETVGSLLSLLRTGARDAFRQFFLDAMLVIEGKQETLWDFIKKCCPI